MECDFNWPWYLDIDANGNTRWYNFETDEEGPISSCREDMDRDYWECLRNLDKMGCTV